MNRLVICLREEKQAKRKGGLYHKTQVNLTCNSNRIEGNRLTEDQTRCIFETRWFQRKGYLLDTCLFAQDTYIEWVKYFYGE